METQRVNLTGIADLRLTLTNCEGCTVNGHKLEDLLAADDGLDGVPTRLQPADDECADAASRAEHRDLQPRGAAEQREQLPAPGRRPGSNDGRGNDPGSSHAGEPAGSSTARRRGRRRARAGCERGSRSGELWVMRQRGSQAGEQQAAAASCGSQPA